MKKIIILIAFITISFSAMSQTNEREYNRWAISIDFGTSAIADESAEFDGYGFSIGGDVRYNQNDKIGFGLSGGLYNINTITGYNDIYAPDIYSMYDNYLYNKDVNIKYGRVNAEVYINVFNILDLHSNKLTVLFHGGPGVSFINTDNNYPIPLLADNNLVGFKNSDDTYSEAVANLRGGMSLLVNLTPRVALKGDLSATSNFEADRTIDGQYNNTIAGINSMVYNASIGLTVRLGKNKYHYDDYIPVEEYAQPISITKNVYGDTTYVSNLYNKNVSNYITIDTTQYVFFYNDEYNIRETELNAIFKTYVNLIDNSSYTLTIKGFASDTDDENLNANSEIYNMELSQDRAEMLKQKIVDMGISEERISIEFYGKDKSFPKESVHDVARRVELIINTN